MRWLYTLVFYLALPLILARLLWRARKAPAYARRWRERFGIFPAPRLKGPVLWLHSVSVGESIAAAPLVRALMERHPEASFVVTTTTPTGSEQVRKLYGDSVFHVYAPYDLPTCIGRFLKRIRPECLVIMETELWPNTVALCRERGIATILANGRLSEKSAAGYRRVSRLMEPVFAGLSAAAIQHVDDARRMQSLGLPPAKSHVTGNIKFDLSIPGPLRARAAQLKGEIVAAAPRPVWIAASTHRGEDEQILSSFEAVRRNHPELFLILVPRHPERFNEVAALCEQRGFRVQRQSAAEPVSSETDILLGDTMGELLMLFGAADLAFVGGSLVPVGGHNLIEPAAWGLPVLSGSHLFNFSEASRLLQGADGMAVAEDQHALAALVGELLSDAGRREAMGQRALAVAEANRGALEKLVEVVETYWAKSAGDT
ncbi:lipid IV(A) 3-deoxy-D-manno-octulosonic acid transferase [Gilvimarinus sp. F26214L]|uniref:lipid IV(A) 3-deoxy-D-manno-octulosonic acid transferase n=1 Tax=Gilvimarinus sp. DZF01 TaxID=3461371 RepID=UPI00404611DC